MQAAALLWLHTFAATSLLVSKSHSVQWRTTAAVGKAEIKLRQCSTLQGGPTFSAELVLPVVGNGSTRPGTIKRLARLQTFSGQRVTLVHSGTLILHEFKRA